MTGFDTAPTTNGTPASGKKDNKKRKSGIPEHNKKTPKKKAGKELNLNLQPGELRWVRTRGYPAWPALVCDEDMLPASLLAKRPVSAASSTGVYRADFLEGGKSARDRRYPIMYLGTNEFNWIINTDLHDLDLDQIKKEVEADNRGKKSKDLWTAYTVAAEEHDLPWYKNMLVEAENESQAIAEAQAKADEEKAEKEREKSEKKAARLSKSGKDGDGDVTMEDATTASAKKADKKRKKSTGEAVGDEQVTKKLKLKFNTKTTEDANTENAKKKSAKKAKETPKKKETPKVEEPQLTEQERAEQRDKKLLYLRHKLQKGFLARDQAPKAEDMADMDDYFKQLVAMGDLDAGMIRNSKINKVLKAILKLSDIPKDEQYDFRGRSTTLLTAWNKTLGVSVTEPIASTPTTIEGPKSLTNGANHESEQQKPSDLEKAASKTEAVEATATKPKDEDETNPAADAGPAAETIDAKPSITASTIATD